MPVSLTSDIPSRTSSSNVGTRCISGGSGSGVAETAGSPETIDITTNNTATSTNTIHEEHNCDSSDGEDDFYTTENNQKLTDKAKAKALRQAQMRRVSLRWPCPYSYCLQHINSLSYNGYYCPPVPVLDNIQSVSVNDALNANVFGITDDNFKNEWLCIYKKK